MGSGRELFEHRRGRISRSYTPRYRSCASGSMRGVESRLRVGTPCHPLSGPRFLREISRSGAKLLRSKSVRRERETLLAGGRLRGTGLGRTRQLSLRRNVPVVCAGPAWEEFGYRMVSGESELSVSGTILDTEMWNVEEAEASSVSSELTEKSGEEMLLQTHPSAKINRRGHEYLAVPEDTSTPESSTAGDTDM